MSRKTDILKQKFKIFVLFISIPVVLSLFLNTDASSRTQEDRVNEIAGELLCPVCKGQSVAESNSALAQDMRETIRQKVEEGKSKKEILEYFQTRYGDNILGSPPFRGINIFLWLLPIFTLPIGAFLIIYILKKYGKAGQKKPGSQTPDKKYIDRIEEELEKTE